MAHFFDWMKNTLFIYSKNILLRLPTVNMKNCLNPKKPKCATPFGGTSPLASYKEIPPPPAPPSGGIVVEWKLKKEIYYRVNVFGIISHGVSKKLLSLLATLKRRLEMNSENPSW